MRAAQAAVPVKLRIGSADVPLGSGAFLIGRSRSCDLVLDSTEVSRRHARLEVRPGRVTIEDLGSANGVFVNGFGIGTGAHRLEHGDRLVIGGHELQIVAGDDEERGSVRGGPTVVTQESAPVYDDYGDEDDPASGSTSTSQMDALELVVPIVDRAFAEGRAHDVEAMLHVHLANVLDDVKRRRPLSDETVARALLYAVRLAHGLRRGRWLDYAFELLTLRCVLLDEELLGHMKTAIPVVDRLDAARIGGYVAALKAAGRAHRQLWSVHQAEQLQRLAAAR